MSCSHCEKNRKEIISGSKVFRYILAFILFGLGFFITNETIKVIVFLFSILLFGFELLKEGLQNLIKFNFEETTLMTIAIIAAFILGEYPESILVIILFKLGELFEEKAVEKSNNNIEEIAKIKAETANLIIGTEVKKVDVKEIKVGDRILVKPGEKIPVDIKIIKGKSTLNTAAITGESIPQEVEENQEILSGSINLTGSIEAEVIRDFEHSAASQIVDLVYEARNNKGQTEKFITKFSKIYTPTVIILAIMIAIFPPLLFGADFIDWIKRSLVFLVASCPCSLVISVPLAFFSCLGAISKKGMIIKGTKHIESLSKSTVIAFDKTGTLTTGEMEIEEIKGMNDFEKEEILSYIYSLEKQSNHPISTAIMKIKDEIKEKEVEEYQEIAGKGIIGKIEGKQIAFGNKKLMQEFLKETELQEQEAIYLSVDGNLAGYITLKEEIRHKDIKLNERYKTNHFNRIIMLTGDNKKAAEKIGDKVGIKEIYSELLPKEKLEIVEKMKKENQTVIFVGDGINDSPVLAAANFGISMKTATEIANSTADGILLSNNLLAIPEYIKIAKKSMRIAKTNIAISIIFKIIVLLLGVLGVAPIWLAVLTDTGLMLVTVINSLRIFKN